MPQVPSSGGRGFARGRVLVLLSTMAAAAGCGQTDAPAPATNPAASTGATGATGPLFKPLDPAAAPPGAGAVGSVLTFPAPPSAGQPPPLGDAQTAAMVTDLASGWPVSLAVGQELSARLTADTGGAKWGLKAGSDAGVLALQGPAVRDTPAGQPPVEVFRLRAVKPGTAMLAFELRKGAEATPLKSVSYSVTVQ